MSNKVFRVYFKSISEESLNYFIIVKHVRYTNHAINQVYTIMLYFDRC